MPFSSEYLARLRRFWSTTARPKAWRGLGTLVLLSLCPAASAVASEPAPVEQSRFSINGFVQNETAYTVAAPDHWSKIRNVAELSFQQKLAADINLKVSGRFFYDGVYDVTTFFPDRVKRDQRFEAMFRETYLDASRGDWSLRVGRQNIIWGEVVGLFFADVVSARDLRELILPDLDYLRIPQWAARTEYFRGDFHAEAIWIPYMTYDRIGKPGSDFYPITSNPEPGFAVNIRNEKIPPHTLSNSAFGFRLGYLLNGWDLTSFYYDSIDASPSFFRQAVAAPVPTFSYRAQHDRIHQVGGTFSKDFQSFVLRGEAVYTWDRWFNVSRTNDENGVVRQNFLDYILGIDVPLPLDSRLNLQFFQRWFPAHDPDILERRVESGVTLFASTKIGDKVEPDLLLIHSLNRSDWLARPRITWQFLPNWRLRAGGGLFGGKKDALFGRFSDRDRVFLEARYAF